MNASSPPTPSDLFNLGIRLEGIFMPEARRKRDALYRNGESQFARFVHYTSAESALNIIKSKRLWMRNTTCMTDYREVEHGFDMLRRFFDDEGRRTRFISALNFVAPDVAQEAIQLFNNHWRTNIRSSTYIASISEHDDNEDLNGRLSMWRAFGHNATRVAIVVRVPWFTEALNVLNIMFSPVAYLREKEVHAVIDEVTQNIDANREFLKGIDRSILIASVFNTLVAGVTCLKHEGFHEEREWRIVYSPQRLPSQLIDTEIKTIGAIPQIIYRLPLDRTVSQNLENLDLANMFDRLIIGPSQFSYAMFTAFSRALTAIGVHDAENRICISGIPIRS